MARSSSESSLPMQRGCCEKGFRFLFRVVNVLLILAGLAVFGYSLYLIKEVKDREGNAKEDGKENSAVEIAKHYWFAEASIAFGAWVVLTSTFALLGAKMDKICCLATHVIFSVLALLTEASVAVTFYFNKGWDVNHLAPLDETGTYKELRKIIREHLKVSLYVGLAVIVLQTLSVMFACVVWGYYTGREEEEDEEHEIWRRPFIQQNSREPEGGSTGDKSEKQKDHPWNKRMREKYGMDTGNLTYDPAASRGSVR